MVRSDRGYPPWSAGLLVNVVIEWSELATYSKDHWYCGNGAGVISRHGTRPNLWPHPNPPQKGGDCHGTDFGCEKSEVMTVELNSFRREAIRRACASYVGGQDRWATLADTGATDEEIEEMLGIEMGISGGSSGPGCLPECHQRNPPSIWLGELTPKGKPTLAGKALIAAVRDVFGIHQKVNEGQLALFEF